MASATGPKAQLARVRAEKPPEVRLRQVSDVIPRRHRAGSGFHGTPDLVGILAQCASER